MPMPSADMPGMSLGAASFQNAHYHRPFPRSLAISPFTSRPETMLSAIWCPVPAERPPKANVVTTGSGIGLSMRVT